MKRKLLRAKSQGTTIFELLLTITLIGLFILASFMIAPNQLKKGRDSKRKTDLERIKISLYDYFFDGECFPKDIPGCGEEFKLGNKIYLNSFPCGSSNDAYIYEVEEGECPQWFKIFTNLENNNDIGIEKVGCESGCGPDCQYNYGLSSTNIRVNQGCLAYYACSPNGSCSEFEDPFISGCPVIFNDDPSCKGLCDNEENRCHDNRGKKTPEE